jgi:beta-glucosidase
MVKKFFFNAALLALAISSVFLCNAQNKNISQKADSVLKLMTLEEKIGQMNQYSSDFAVTGPITKDGDKQNQVRKGLIGSFLNVRGAERTRSLQEIAMQSRLKIPLLFGQDVIHGYRTIFPIPLAEAASWDLKAIQQSAHIAAKEAAAAGIHWTFAPMVDIARDPRWGRIMEGAGEDTYLGSLIAAARVKGFQGNKLGSTDAVMACAKHFAAYGAALGGRDYNSVDMSPRNLYEVYLPPFKAAVDAGAATLMNSFNDLNGIPATGNKMLLRNILKNQWNFKGFVVSDWGSIGEMVNHGYATNSYEAAMLAANAGNDMDMESRSYLQHLSKLVKDGKVSISVVDDAVKRILQKKFELGLFDNPYKFCDTVREKEQWNNKENLQAARVMAQKSIVLLKNENVLPLRKEKMQDGVSRTIAMIGPFVKAKTDNLSLWSFNWPDDSVRLVSLWEGVAQKISDDTRLLYAQGCGVNDTSYAGFNEAIATANNADIIIATVGEAGDMSGEARSRSNLHLPGVQEALINALVKTGKPIIVLVSGGRPLIFNDVADKAKAVVYTWWLGTQAGNAIADVLFGDYNPSGKLPVSFPRSEGQIPMYYNYFSTGRPAKNDSDKNFVSVYIDLPNSPKYPFGYGLSYTSFKYGDVVVSKTNLKQNDKLDAIVTISNTGSYAGEEVVQLYVRDVAGSVVRPVKELKGFQKVLLQPGQSQTVKFTITVNNLKFYNNELKYDWEPGEFEIMIGTNSKELKTVKVNWSK